MYHRLIGLKLSDFYILPKHIALQKLYNNYNIIHSLLTFPNVRILLLGQCRIVKQLQYKIEEKEYNHENTSIVWDLNLRGITRRVLISF